VGKKKNCKRPTRPCGGAYTKKSRKGIIKHGKFHLIKCKEGYRLINVMFWPKSDIIQPALLSALVAFSVTT
jgi:hypothetical protein